MIANGESVDHLGFLDIGELQRKLWVPLLFEQKEGVRDVFGGYRRSIGEPGLLAQIEGDALAVIGALHRVSNQSVERVRFVLRRQHQAVEQKAEPLCRIPFQDIGVERIERDKPGCADHGQPASFWSVRIDIVEMLEVRPILQFAECRKPMTALARVDAMAYQAGEDDERQGTDRHPAAEHLGCRRADHFASASFAAARSSHHQTVGKPTERAGSFSGCPNRSQ